MRALFSRVWAALNRPVFSRGPDRRSAARKRRERGIAMVVVVSSLAVLTAVTVEFRYQTSIDLQLAVNGRDELRAEALARSSVNFSRLILRAQRRMNSQLQQLAGTFASLANPVPGVSLNLDVQLWTLLPVNTALFGLLSGAAPLQASALGGEGVGTAFGDFSGDFDAKFEIEETKFNPNRMPGRAGDSAKVAALQGLGMLAEPKLSFIFEQDDAWGVRLKPEEVLTAMYDWADPGDNQATLTGNPWGEGSGDENRYSQSNKYPHRYRSKNASFDSVDELYQVDGVSDLFGAAFLDRMTVWSDKSAGLNPNTDDPLQTYLNIVSVVSNKDDPKLAVNSIPMGMVFAQLQAAKAFAASFGGIKAKTLIDIVRGQGFAIDPTAERTALTDKRETIKIRAMGHVGSVTKNLTFVIRTDDGLGKILYYREE